MLETNNINPDLHRYPEIDGSSLREAIAINFSLIVIELFLALDQMRFYYLQLWHFVKMVMNLHANHGFEMYSIVSKVVGAVPKKLRKM